MQIYSHRIHFRCLLLVAFWKVLATLWLLISRRTQQTNNPADTIGKHCLYILTKQTYGIVTTVTSRIGCWNKTSLYTRTCFHFSLYINIYMHKPKILYEILYQYCHNKDIFHKQYQKLQNTLNQPNHVKQTLKSQQTLTFLLK